MGIACLPLFNFALNAYAHPFNAQKANKEKCNSYSLLSPVHSFRSFCLSPCLSICLSLCLYTCLHVCLSSFTRPPVPWAWPIHLGLGMPARWHRLDPPPLSLLSPQPWQHHRAASPLYYSVNIVLWTPPGLYESFISFPLSTPLHSPTHPPLSLRPPSTDRWRFFPFLILSKERITGSQEKRGPEKKMEERKHEVRVQVNEFF